MATDFVNPNDVQVAGDHYKASNGIQHWDLIELNGLGYLEGYASKYLVRWQEKNGLEDLEKAKHCVEKLLHLHFNEGRMSRGIVPTATLQEFIQHNSIEPDTALALEYLLQWQTPADLSICVAKIDGIIKREAA